MTICVENRAINIDNFYNLLIIMWMDISFIDKIIVSESAD